LKMGFISLLSHNRALQLTSLVLWKICVDSFKNKDKQKKQKKQSPGASIVRVLNLAFCGLAYQILVVGSLDQLVCF